MWSKRPKFARILWEIGPKIVRILWLKQEKFVRILQISVDNECVIDSLAFIPHLHAAGGAVTATRRDKIKARQKSIKKSETGIPTLQFYYTENPKTIVIGIKIGTSIFKKGTKGTS